MTELQQAEQRVVESHTLIEQQRRRIEELAHAGNDITSAQIVLDSLRVSLFLHLEERHRLRAMARQPDQNIDRISGEDTMEPPALSGAQPSLQSLREA